MWTEDKTTDRVPKKYLKTDEETVHSKAFFTPLIVSMLVMIFASRASGQNPEMQERIAEVRQAVMANMQTLGQYTWTEQDTFLVKGEEKKEELYNVRLGPGWKPQKTAIDPSSVSDEERPRHGLRARIIVRKTKEYKEYAASIKMLIQQYIPPEKEKLQQAYQQSNVVIGPQAGAPGEYKLVVSNYLKQGDRMTLVTNKAQKDLVRLRIASYLSSPDNAVNVTAEFSRLPGGANHVAAETISEVSKHLSLEIQNPNYQYVGSLSQEAPPPTETGNPTEPTPQSQSQLQTLVAPIALYPDSLVAQILTASTFPDQVAIANYWMQDHKNLTGSALMEEVNKQTWDPSVKAVTQFPSVLENMAKNLAWTSSLGEAYHNQQADVMNAVQTLRKQAKDKGNLKSSSQITVVQQSPDVIVIKPTNPQVVYVPEYNPAVVYGVPYVVPSYVAPAYTAGDVAAAGIIGFGAGIAVGAMMSGGCCSWGYSSWNCGWHGTAVVYHGGAYYGNAAWHGGYYGGYGTHVSGAYGGASTYHGAYGSAASYHGWGANGTYHTGSAYNSAWGSGASHTTYAPDGASHTSGGTYNKTTGESSHYGSSTGAFGGSTYHGSTSSGQHYAGGTTASGKSWGGSNTGGWASRADSSRGWSSMHSSGFSGGRFGGGGFGGGRFR